MSSALRVVTEVDFDEVVLASPVPVLVDFFTVWCAPCKALAPTLEDLSEEYDGRFRVVSVDAEQSPELAKRYDVTGYPTMVLIKDGEEIDRPEVRSKVDLRTVFDGALGLSSAEVVASIPETDDPLSPAVLRVLELLSALDEDAWVRVEERTQALFTAPAEAPSPAREVDAEALTAAQTRLMNDVEELATAKVGRAYAHGIGSAAAASFERWVRGSATAPGFAGAFRSVPAARMSPYLPEALPASIDEAAATYVDALAALPDHEWVSIRAVNRDLWPFAERMQGKRMSAWLAAVILLQSLTSADLIPADVRAACWEPFEGVLSAEAAA